MIVEALQNKVPDEFDSLQESATNQEIATAIKNSNLDSEEILLSKITGVSNQSLGTYTNTYTIPEDGVYEIIIQSNHVADSCPPGTGRYAATFYLNSDIIYQYNGKGYTTSYRCVKYLQAGNTYSAANIATWCSDCSYSHAEETASITVIRWNFELE